MPPVCSPTAIMEITIGGNTLDFASGWAMVSPPAIDARDSITALWMTMFPAVRSEEHTSELQSPYDLVCRLLLEKKNVQSPSHPDWSAGTSNQALPVYTTP